MRRRRARERLGRSALILFGCALAILTLELALQLGAWVVTFTHPSRGAAQEPGLWRILCVGDSNTYGLHLDPQDSYPAQLERALGLLEPTRPVEVLNLGVPGLNSSRLLREFPELLEAIAPDLVIVLIGVNDLWTDPSAESTAAPEAWLKRNSRVLRLIRLLRARGKPEIEVDVSMQQQESPFVTADSWVRVGDRTFDFGYARAAEPAPPDQVKARLDANLHQLRQQAEQAGARVLFMTYPGQDQLYGRANPLIWASAHRGLPLLDLSKVFRKECPDEPCATLLFADRHPNAAGARLMSERIAAWIQAHR